MLKVRLQRVGRRNRPAYRMVVIEHTKGPKSRNYIEILGSHDPINKVTNIKGDRVKHWISQGAQTSDTVHNMLITHKIIEGKKVNALSKKSPIVKDAEEATADEVDAAASGDSEETTTEEAPAEETKDEAPTEEETKEEPKAEADEAPAEETKDEEKKEA